MPQLPFQPDPGLFTDTTSFSGRGGWLDCRNVRFWSGRWQVIGGWTQRGSLGITAVNAIHEWVASDGTDYIVWGATGALKVEKTGVLYDIKPATSGNWVFANYGETLIANVSGGKIWQWSLNTAAIALQVANAPVQVTCILVTPSRQLIALGCNEEISTTFNGRCIRCSDTEDPTSWTTAATNNVEENILDGARSGIVTAKMVGDYVAVWTSTDLWMGTFIGDPGQAWRYERAGSLCGAISLNGVCVDGNTAYWLTPDLVFMAWSPGSEPTEIACPIINYLRSVFPTNAAKVAVTFACHVAKFNEVWFTFSNNTGQYVGRYVAFSLTDGKWFKGDVNRVAMHQGISGLLGAMSIGGPLITCESGLKGLTNTGTDLQWSITSSGIFLDQGKRRFMLRTFYPDFGDSVGDVTGNITVTVTMNSHTAGTAVTASKALVVTSTTTKKDFRLSGQVLSVSFSGDDGVNGAGVGTTDTAARQGLCTFDMQPMGER